MILRSSSTPVLGSLLSSFSESPNRHLNSEPQHTLKHPAPPTHHHHSRPLLPLNCSSSPRTHSALESPGNSFRRSNSEGNLAGLAANHDDHFSNSPLPRPPKCFQKRPAGSVLETIPPLSFHNTLRPVHDDEEEDFERGNSGLFENSSLGLESSDRGIKFLNAYKSFEFVEEQAHSRNMYLARELEVENGNIGFGGGSGSGGGGGGDFVPVAYGRDGGDGKRQGAEERYKNLVEENPGNPLFLRNYAQFLFESKKDLEKSEELYSRAILADPGDGEVLSQYAKLIWELHHDQDRALNYFERAVQAAPADSHAHAAYASFLWEIEGEEEDNDGDLQSHSNILNSQFHQGVMSSTSA